MVGVGVVAQIVISGKIGNKSTVGFVVKGDKMTGRIINRLVDVAIFAYLLWFLKQYVAQTTGAIGINNFGIILIDGIGG